MRRLANDDERPIAILNITMTYEARRGCAVRYTILLAVRVGLVRIGSCMHEFMTHVNWPWIRLGFTLIQPARAGSDQRLSVDAWIKLIKCNLKYKLQDARATDMDNSLYIPFPNFTSSNC